MTNEQKALKVALEALQFYAENETFIYDNGHDWPTSVSEKAMTAVFEIEEILDGEL